MSALDRRKARKVLQDLTGVRGGFEGTLTLLESCVIPDAAATTKLADPAIAWYADQHRTMQAKLASIEAILDDTENRVHLEPRWAAEHTRLFAVLEGEDLTSTSPSPR